MKKKKIKIKPNEVLKINFELFNNNIFKQKIIPNKKKKIKKFNLKKDIADYLNIKNFMLVLK